MIMLVILGLMQFLVVMVFIRMNFFISFNLLILFAVLTGTGRSRPSMTMFLLAELLIGWGAILLSIEVEYFLGVLVLALFFELFPFQLF